MSDKSWRGVLNRFKAAPPGIQRYFEHVPHLAEHLPWDVTLAYLFAQVELAHNMTLYCAAVKLHHAEASSTWSAVQRHHMTRGEFRRLFESIVGVPLDPVVVALLTHAERTRDGIMHGKPPREADKRRAVVDVIAYAEQFNNFVDRHAGLRPFGTWRGFKGRGKALDKSTTRWMLKGMGFSA